MARRYDWHPEDPVRPILVRRCPRCNCTFARRDPRTRCTPCQNETEAGAT